MISVLRFGRCIDTLHSTLALFRHDNQTVKTTLILSKIAHSLFLLADHILWLGRSDLWTVRTDKWVNIANKYWLYSLVMNLTRDFYEISTILAKERSIILPSSGLTSLNDYLDLGSNVLKCALRNKQVVVDTVKNGCDFFIPLTALGHTNLSPGTIGWLGVVSSLAGLVVLVEPLMKLSPS